MKHLIYLSLLLPYIGLAQLNFKSDSQYWSSTQKTDHRIYIKPPARPLPDNVFKFTPDRHTASMASNGDMTRNTNRSMMHNLYYGHQFDQLNAPFKQGHFTMQKFNATEDLKQLNQLYKDNILSKYEYESKKDIILYQ